MCNCNQQRAMYKTTDNRRQSGSVKVMLVKNKAVTINGDVTGRLYLFRNKNDTLWIDAGDAAYMRGNKDLQVFF